MPKVFRLLTVLCLLFVSSASAQDKMTTQLDELKKHNDLEKWLYVRLDKTYADPQQQLAFLMATQKEAWRQPNTIQERAAWLVLLSNQGYYELQAGNILSSINSYEEAYTYLYKYHLQQAYDGVEYILKPLSNNYTRLGDYERAIFIQQKAINTLSKDSVDNIASLYSNMAIAYYNMANYPEAESSIAKGKAIVKDARVKLQLNNTLADILYEKGDLKQASALIKQNIAASPKPDSQTAYWLMGEYTTLGNINLKSNDLESAGQSFAKALALINTWYPGTHIREKVNIITQLAIIQRLKQHSAKALALLDEAFKTLPIKTGKIEDATMYAENKLVEIFYQKALTYQGMQQSEIALRNMFFALNVMDNLRKEFADDKTKERLQQEAKQLAENTIELCYHLYNKTHDKTYLDWILEIAEKTKTRTLADQRQRNMQQLVRNNKDTTLTKKIAIERAIVYNQKMMMTEKDPAPYQKKIDALKFDLALLDKSDREQAAAKTSVWPNVQSALPDSLQAIEFFWGERFVYRIDISHRAVTGVTRVDSAKNFKARVDQLIGTYYQHGADAMLNAPKAFYQLSNSIYSTLFKDYKLSKNEHLYVIPDDVLGYLSFDGLITSNQYEPAMSQWPFLIKRLTTNYAFSLGILVHYIGQPPSANKFGGLFITHQNTDGKPIVAVEKEAAAIKNQVGGTYMYNDQVNMNAFLNVFENSSVLHISTHAYLSGINKEPTLDFGREKLFLFELLAKKQKPNLIVLSACGTGDGLLAKGEGIISLSRGFSAIGTPATIASLWNVNDDAVSGITASIYKGLIANQTSGTALHNAKLSWLNSSQTSDAMYLPYYWDSLILMGTDEPQHLQPSSNWLWVYGVGALLVIISIITLLVKRQKRRP